MKVIRELWYAVYIIVLDKVSFSMHIDFGPASQTWNNALVLYTQRWIQRVFHALTFPTSALEGDSVIELYSNGAVGRDTGLVQYVFRKWT